MTYSFRNYKETKELRAMKLRALLTSSGSYIVAKFQLVSAVLRKDITVLQKVSGNRATNCSHAGHLSTRKSRHQQTHHQITSDLRTLDHKLMRLNFVQLY